MTALSEENWKALLENLRLTSHGIPYYQIDHSHCWNQGKKPACGIPLETHKVCCLCAIERKEVLPDAQ